MSLTTTTRNATLQDLAALLMEQQARQNDVVVSATSIRARNGQIVLSGSDVDINADGVTVKDGIYVPTRTFDEGVASKLDIGGYLHKLRSKGRLDLYDRNVNGLLHGQTHVANSVKTVLHLPNQSKFLVRTFRGNDGPGIARAFLSDRFKALDNLDVLTAAMEGIQQAGINVEVTSADLSESRMYVRVAAPEVRALAPELLKGYRSPFADPNIYRVGGGGWTPQRALQAAAREGQGYTPGTEPVIFAGFVLSNSEVGKGRFTLTPSVIVEICGNGLQMTIDAIGDVHLGGRLDEGIVEWSTETQRKQLAVITSKTTDAVRKFLTPGWLTSKVEQLQAQASKPITDAPKVIEHVGRTLTFTEQERATILSHFILGGQMTAGGVLQAVTSAAQTVEDADRANKLESSAVKAMTIAAS